MDKVRLGIIGVGNMGSGHIENIVAGKCPEIEVTAIADRNHWPCAQSRARAACRSRTPPKCRAAAA